jgi:hypothetical protein
MFQDIPYLNSYFDRENNSNKMKIWKQIKRIKETVSKVIKKVIR